METHISATLVGLPYACPRRCVIKLIALWDGSSEIDHLVLVEPSGGLAVNKKGEPIAPAGTPRRSSVLVDVTNPGRTEVLGKSLRNPI